MKTSILKMLMVFILFNNATQSGAQVSIVGFYNCENFYDTIHQAHVIDEDFLPNSEKKYNSTAFEMKAKQLATVLYKLGRLYNADGFSFIGLAEIENKSVLTTLINEPLLKKYHYKFIHFDSKDPRGVDVAFVYSPAHFTPFQYKPFSLTDETHFNHYATRDILFIKGKLENEWIHVLVNHWPSRRGGEHISASKRVWASAICKKIIDSVQSQDPSAKFIVMGDFNDNPNNSSIKMLKMTNPFLQLFRRGMGSIAFNDSWHLFDQILLSSNWNKPEIDHKHSKMENEVTEKASKLNNFTLNNYKPVIYNNFDMVEEIGKYRGYPKRTYNGLQFRGGYSDHFPVALIFTLNSVGNTQ